MKGQGRRSRLSKPMRSLLLFGSLAALMICILAAGVLWILRQNDIEDAKRELRTIDLLLVEEAERAMESVDLILKSVQQHLAADGVTSLATLEATRTGLDTHELLRSKIAGVPQIEALSLIGADGRLLNLSRLFPIPAINLADRDYFAALRDASADMPLLTRPVVSRISGKETMFLARRISSPSGEFLGIVLGTIDLAYFERRYQAIRGGNGVVVTLWHRDGIALARFPPLHPGEKIEAPALSHAPRADDALTFLADRADDGPPRIVAMMAAGEFPLTVTISKTLDEVLADWRRKAILTLLASGFAITAIALGAWLLGRQFATYEALRIALDERSEAIAAREAAEAQLRQAQKLEAIGQLTGGIAHDFNNLLTAILGNLELLQRHNEAKDPRVQRWSTNAIEAAKRGAALTARLLAFSRRQPLEPQAANVAHRLDSLTDLLARTLGESIEVTTTIEPSLWYPFVDLSGLDNAILNIALNARDAMDGRGRLAIEAKNRVFDASMARAYPGIAEGEYVWISIADTGRGIPQDVIDRVFEPFFTTKPPGQGTGLGLSQVYGFVKQSGGHIALISEMGRGTIVNMYLPRATAEEEAPLPSAGEEEDETVSAADARGTILVVENDENVRAYAVETLRELGFSVYEAADARSGLAALGADKEIFLLVTDVGLPGMNGRELADEALRLRPDLDVIFITGYAREAVAGRDETDLLAPNVTLITKPFTRAELLQKLRAIFARQMRTHEADPPVIDRVGLGH
jgi:signal transduction histidine kinase/ActR/RegA family two-component response regulator